MKLLSDEQKFPDDEELKRRMSHVPNWEKFSSIFVTFPELNWGSRIKTVILIDNDNRLDFYEEALQADGTWSKTHLERNLW